VGGLSTRPYRGADDLRRMQHAVSRRFGHGTEHVGDLAWGMRSQSHAELAPLVTLVESSGGELAGYLWFAVNGWCEAVTLGDVDGVAAMLVAAVGHTAARLLECGDHLDRISVLCNADDAALSAALIARGYAPIAGALEVTRRALADLPQPSLPPGTRFSGVEDDAMVAERVEAHRAAFAPSELTVQGFHRVRRTWPYRAELDRVVVDGSGRVLAACLAWLDPDVGWGLLEPVATRPEQQRRGLGRAVCLDALHALRAAGAHSAQVACESGGPGCATYQSIGFRTVHRMAIMRRTL
jgi:predicted N-acetyltransferase YhbS